MNYTAWSLHAYKTILDVHPLGIMGFLRNLSA